MKYSGELSIIRIVGINNSKVHSFWDETKKKAYKCKRGDRDYYMTLEEIGEKLGISRQRVREIQNKAIRKLQHPKRSGLLKTFAF
jgi:DNA-directed RNA polymerase sigma subunit (sigma70/sigma32)